MVLSTSAFPFAKLICGGNDFIILDCRERALPADPSSFVRMLCDRSSSVGADGAIFLLPDDHHPFRILLYNEDGSRAAVSYNGSRCLGRHAVDAGLAESLFTFGSEAGEIAVAVDGRRVTLQVPSPYGQKLRLELPHEGEVITAHFITAGVPYLVIWREDLQDPWVERVPFQLRSHPLFPEKTNVAVARREAPGRVTARFFERGVDVETPSSGSGCVAVAAITSLLHDDPSPIAVTCGGGSFTIAFRREADVLTDVATAGDVLAVCSGLYSGA